VSERALAAFRDRLREPLSFTLNYLDAITGVPRERWFRIADRPARVWIVALFSDEPGDMLLDLLEDEDADWLWEGVQDPGDPLDERTLWRIGVSVLGRACDRPWWEASRLLSIYAQHWKAFDGLAADRGQNDPLDWPVARLCNWVEHRMLSGQQKESERNALSARLAAPPPMLDDEEEMPGWSRAGRPFISRETGNRGRRNLAGQGVDRGHRRRLRGRFGHGERRHPHAQADRGAVRPALR
jgi:hypothetical protein